MIQRTPWHLGSLPPTTCLGPECKLKDRIFQPGEFRISIEPIQNCSSSTNDLGYRAMWSNKVVQQSSRHWKHSKRGQGAHDEWWICVRCFDSLVEEGCRFVSRGICNEVVLEVGGNPNRLFAEHLFGDKRQISRFQGRYTLPSNLNYAVEKWKAVQRFVESQKTSDKQLHPRFPHGINIPPQLFLGADGMSLYLDEETRDMRGELEEPRYKGIKNYKNHSEIGASACLNVSLLVVLEAADKQMKERMLAIDQMRWVQGAAVPFQASGSKLWHCNRYGEWTWPAPRPEPTTPHPPLKHPPKSQTNRNAAKKRRLANGKAGK